MANAPTAFSSFSNKFRSSFNKNNEETKGNDQPTTNNQQRRVGHTKVNPVLTAVTDNYIDDPNLYKPRITRTERLDYFLKIVALENNNNNHHQANIAKERVADPDSWLGKEIGILNQQSHYSHISQQIFLFITSQKWDHLCINGFLLWLLFIIFIQDRWVELYAPWLLPYVENHLLLIAPSFFMFLSQVIPFLGTFYLMHYMNDLCHHHAAGITKQEIEFGKWAWSSVLVAQYIEYYYYGGRGLRDRAGRCALHQQNHLPSLDSKPSLSWLQRITHFFQWNHDAKVHDLHENNSNSEDNSNEESQSDDNKNNKNNNHSDDNNEDTNENDEDNEKDIEDGLSSKEKSETSMRNFGASSKTEKLTSALQSLLSLANEEIEEEIHPEQHDKLQHELEKENANLQAQLAADVEAAKASGVEYITWTCLVCNTSNHRAKVNRNPNWQITFGERGRYYKQIYASMRPENSEAICKKCFTPYNYVPPKATTHLFPRHPQPHLAFQEYPIEPPAREAGAEEEIAGVNGNEFAKNYILHGLPPLREVTAWQRGIFAWKSFLWGTYNELYQPRLMFNDWQLRKYIQDTMPEIPRYQVNHTMKASALALTAEKNNTNAYDLSSSNVNNSSSNIKTNSENSASTAQAGRPSTAALAAAKADFYEEPEEHYELGEIIECKLQKSDFQRGKIIAIRKNFTYDVRYDTGDEIRFVDHKSLRLGFQKPRFAYRVEMGLVIFMILFTFACLLTSVSTMYLNLLFLGPLLISVFFFSFRWYLMIQYVVNFHHAGAWVIGKTTFVFTLPWFFLMIASSLGLSYRLPTATSSNNSLTGIVALLILTKVTSLPLLYIVRPIYAIIGSIIFLQTSIALIFLSIYVSAYPLSNETNSNVFAKYIACGIGPLITTALTLKYLRTALHTIWDVCLVIRPELSPWRENPLLTTTIQNKCSRWYDKLMERFQGD
jgi:hypothetical protein